MSTYLYLAQIVTAIAVIVLCLVQAKDAGLGSMFGGGDIGVYKTKRGAEKTMFNATIGLGIFFMVLAVATVLLTK